MTVRLHALGVGIGLGAVGWGAYELDHPAVAAIVIGAGVLIVSCTVWLRRGQRTQANRIIASVHHYVEQLKSPDPPPSPSREPLGEDGDQQGLVRQLHHG